MSGCPVQMGTSPQGGLTADVSQDLGELSAWQPNVAVVIGGTIWETDEAPDIGSLLNAQREKGAVVAGICGGRLALARAGLLNDVPHTSNDANFLNHNAKSYSSLEHFRKSASAVAEDLVITAPGTAPVSFAAAVFEGAGLDVETVSQFKRMLAAEHA